MFGQESDIEARIKFQGFQVDLEDGFSFFKVGQFNIDLAVEPACTHECAVEDVGPVCCSQDDDSGVGAKSVHLCKKLVQGVLPFVIGACDGIAATGASNGINFIDENDAGRFFFCLTEEVTYTGCTYSDKHLHKIGS